MNALRRIVEGGYDRFRDTLFKLTPDPETAHERFVTLARATSKTGLDQLLLDMPERVMHGVPISNAAGFNKNGTIPPAFLYHLGFDRVIIGTVTADPYAGNPRPRIVRYQDTGSMVNWMGLPGVGAEQVFESLKGHIYEGRFTPGVYIPLTINLMATPGKRGDGVLKDIEKTMKTFLSHPDVDRFELNISCPNTHGSACGMDARREYQAQLDEMLGVTDRWRAQRDVYLKVSPDLTREGVDDIVNVASKHKVEGYTTTNTTTIHDPQYISDSPGKGGASGNAVYDRSSLVQLCFANALSGSEAKIIAAGGISSKVKAQQRIDAGASEIQLFTPLIFRGPLLLRELRGLQKRAY